MHVPPALGEGRASQGRDGQLWVRNSRRSGSLFPEAELISTSLRVQQAWQSAASKQTARERPFAGGALPVIHLPLPSP